MDLDVEIVLAVLELLGIACLWNLWFREKPALLRRVGWSCVIVVPLFGPLLYYALFQALAPQSELLRARETSGVEVAARHVAD